MFLYGVMQLFYKLSLWPFSFITISFVVVVHMPLNCNNNKKTLLRGQTIQVREVLTLVLATQTIFFTFIECFSLK